MSVQVGEKMELLTIVHRNKIEYLPIIYAFSDEITRHILFFDHAKEERGLAQELKASIERFNAKYGFKTEIKLIEIDEDSKKDMEQIAQVFKGKSENVYLNGAGADTALFTVLSSIILSNGGKVLAYDKEDNSYNVITKNGFLNKKIKRSMNLEDCLTLMGETILDEVSKPKILQQKEALELLFSDIKRMFKIRFLLKTRKTKELKSKYPKIVEALKKLKIVDANGAILGQEGFVKFGYLFEEFVYVNLVPFDFDDIRVGVKIEFDKEQVAYRNIRVINEFDILTIKENKIGFIECKLGDSSDPLSTVYKSDSVMEYFGESATSMILNMQRNKQAHIKNPKGNFGESVIYRAKTKRVTVYNAFDFSKNSFSAKIKEAFGVELKEQYKKEFEKKGLSELSKKWS